MLPLFFSGLLSYLVKMCPTQERELSLLLYVLVALGVRGKGKHFFSKFYVTFILQWIAFIFGSDKEEDQ